jgi:hypothetical protein
MGVRTHSNFKVGVFYLQELPLPSIKGLLLESSSKPPPRMSNLLWIW